MYQPEFLLLVVVYLGEKRADIDVSKILLMTNTLKKKKTSVYII